MYFDFRIRRDFERMEIQQVAFDGEGIGAERRSISDIGDRIKTLVFHARARNVHAVLRYQFFVACKVDSRNCVFRSIAPPSACS